MAGRGPVGGGVAGGVYKVRAKKDELWLEILCMLADIDL